VEGERKGRIVMRENAVAAWICRSARPRVSVRRRALPFQPTTLKWAKMAIRDHAPEKINNVFRANNIFTKLAGNAPARSVVPRS